MKNIFDNSVWFKDHFGENYIKLNKMMEDHIQKVIGEINHDRDVKIDYLLRYIIDKPIKGEITKGKLRVRGITYLVYNRSVCVGIMQHGKIINFVDVPENYKKEK